MWSSVLFLSVYCGLYSAANSIGCREPGRVISTDELLLPLQNIAASSELLLVQDLNSFVFEDDFFINFGVSNSTAVWCTAPNDPSSSITLTFTEPVVITAFVSGGYNLPPVYNYVDKFTVEFAASLGDEFVPYTGQNLFSVSTLNTLLYVEEPFEAQRLKFSIVHHSNNFGSTTNLGCWTLAIFGCNTSEAIRAPSETTVVPETTVAIPTSTGLFNQPLTTTVTITQSTCPRQSEDLEPSPTVASGETDPSLSQRTVVEKDFMVLAIVLPIALLTVLAVAVIVAIGVYICVRRQKNESPPVHVQYSIRHDSSSMKVLDNSGLYMSTSPGGEDGQLMPDLGNVPNILYQEMHSRPGEAVDQIYETIGSGMEDDLQPNDNYNTPPKPQQTGQCRNHGLQMSMNESYRAVQTGGEDGHYYYPSVVLPGTDGGRSS